MIIRNPKNAVVAFNQLEWAIDEEPSPKAELRNYLRSRYEVISGNKIRSIGDDGEDEKDEVDDDDDSELRKILLDVVYDRFSVTESGEILLIYDSGDEEDWLMLTDADARALLPKMRKKLEERIIKINALLKHLVKGTALEKAIDELKTR